MTLLFHRREVTSDAAEGLRSGGSAETSRYLLLHLRHPQVSLGQISASSLSPRPLHLLVNKGQFTHVVRIAQPVLAIVLPNSLPHRACPLGKRRHFPLHSQDTL
jgi:hypothetical protein